MISPAGASYLLDRETEKKRDETSFSPIEQQIGRYYYYLMLWICSLFFIETWHKQQQLLHVSYKTKPNR